MSPQAGSLLFLWLTRPSRPAEPASRVPYALSGLSPGASSRLAPPSPELLPVSCSLQAEASWPAAQNPTTALGISSPLGSLHQDAFLGLG